VIEGDEYDCAFFDKRPKFVHYLPNVAIVGNVEFDHADIYPDLAAVQLAFTRFLNVVPRGGLLVAGTESPALVEVLPKARSRVETFGLHEGADWRAVDVRTGPEGSRFRLVRRGRDEGCFTLATGGEHNVRNALAALAAAAEAGVEPGAAREALAAFQGVRRRLEVRGAAGGVTVYDDFAHHPTAVAATLAALRALGGGGRLVAVFEPRSYTAKTRVFQDGFARAFTAADRVIVAASHLPGKVPEGLRLSEAGLVEGIRREGAEADFIPTVDEIVRALVAEVRPGDRIAILSNGGFGGIHDKLLRALEAAARP
jgi:UDP-N-acetylmuramate: L-alanyl-gamma-D-glutamyl-meso-diaminopimelate ligase